MSSVEFEQSQIENNPRNAEIAAIEIAGGAVLVAGSIAAITTADSDPLAHATFGDTEIPLTPEVIFGAVAIAGVALVSAGARRLRRR